LVVWKCRKTHGFGGICGRIATWLKDGWELGMYDEEPDVVGSGAQDLDFKDRVLTLGPKLVVTLTQREIGICLPNTGDKDSGDFGTEWSKAKIRNCDPADLQRFETWGKFSNHNHSIFDKEFADGTMERNSRQFGATFRRWVSTHGAQAR
jgi:hypothetical protein